MSIFTNRSYTVGWICALPLEMAAARAMLDEDYGIPKNRDASDRNNYHTGRIGDHRIVIACLPNGVYGTSSATFVAAQLLSTFKSINIGLMVGIGAGVPSPDNDIRLGDVVVSKPGKAFGGVVQYDFGKTVGEGKFKLTASLNKPPQVLLTAMSSLEADHMLGENKIPKLVSLMLKKHPDMQQEFAYPGAQCDQLYNADYEHASEDSTCDFCDASRLKQRPVRSQKGPVVHYGLIASGNQVMRHAATRDRLREQLDILCFEMEAAGLMDNFPCLIIRGICDYADSHKSKRWQKYAAATAAAYAKELLRMTPVTDTSIDESCSLQPPSISQNEASSTFIFTNTPYSREDIPLAGLVPDKRYPHQDTLSVLQLEEGRDYSVRVDKFFNQRISKSSSSFKTIIMNLFSASSPIQISSAEGRMYELRQPKALFEILCSHEEVRKWLEDIYISGEVVYFIVGYRTLMNGSNENIETVGERIYAICYRKVGFGFLNGTANAFLKKGNRWKPFFNIRGSELTVDDIIRADIEDDDDDGDGIDSVFENFENGNKKEKFVYLNNDIH